MKIQIKATTALAIKEDCCVVPIFENVKKDHPIIKQLDTKLNAQIAGLIKDMRLTGKANECVAIHTLGTLPSTYLLFVGLGKERDCTYNTLRNAAGEVARQANALKAKQLGWVLYDNKSKVIDEANLAQALVEGLVLGGYEYKDYITDKKAKKSGSLSTLVLAKSKKQNGPQLLAGAQAGLVVGRAVNTARDLANRPSNTLTPKRFMEEATQKIKTTKITMDVIDKKRAEQLGMHAFLGVAQGSVEEPYMLVMTYAPIKNQKPICLVGKGVTFDSGGISIKPSKGMSEMKADMSGAAAVYASMLAIADLELQKNVTAIIPLAENMPSGKAQRPGDVVSAMNGKTIEVINTDAEGRLILADALCYAVEHKVARIIDIATLTGACTIALGDKAAAVLGNNSQMINALIKSSEFTGDRLWELPLYDDYIDYLKSDIADIANCSEGRMAGTASAAKFLEQFVDKTPWAHLDIAGVMSYTAPEGYTVKGMSGSGVRNLVDYVINA